MTTWFGALAAAAPFAAAWVTLSRTLRDAPLLRVAAAAALSLGLTSIAWFLFRIARLPIGAYVIVELLVVAAVLLRHWRGVNGVAVVARDSRRWTTADAALAVYVVAAISAAALVFAQTMTAHPHGSSDAWAMWSLKAAFLAEPSAAWRDGFAAGTELPHVDYPLLLPGAIARVAYFTGDLPLSARLVAFVTLAGTVAALAGAVRQRSETMMAAAAVALLLTPGFVTQAAMLNADVLVGFYALLAIALLQRSDGTSVPPAASPPTILTGFYAGCAAWTKNEGLIVAGGVLIYLAWRWLRGRERTATLTDLLIGLWPMLVLVIAFKLWTPANDLVDGVLAPGAWQRWLDTFRVAFV